MSGWRIEELDAGADARRRVADPMELVLLVLVALVAASLLPRALAPAAPLTRALPSYERVTASGPPASLAATLRLAARPLERGACGALSAASPTPTYGGVASAVRRIDASLSIAVDPHWWWCVAGARFYDDGVEVVGRFIPIRDATGGPRPRVALRSTELGGQLEGFGALGPGSFATAGTYDVLRLRAVGDNGRRAAYRDAVARTTTLTLQLSSMSGEWGFLRAPALERDPALLLAARDADGAVRGIYLTPLAEFAVRLSLAP